MASHYGCHCVCEVCVDVCNNGKFMKLNLMFRLTWINDSPAININLSIVMCMKIKTNCSRTKMMFLVCVNVSLWKIGKPKMNSDRFSMASIRSDPIWMCIILWTRNECAFNLGALFVAVVVVFYHRISHFHIHFLWQKLLAGMIRRFGSFYCSTNRSFILSEH